MNNAQNEAVEYVGGPLLIVAGAGTGKTTVITEKISHLVRNGLAKPEEILALTFTDKAAEEMQTRVDALLDIGYAELQISTFHAFCQELLERHGLDIGLPNRFKLATETDAWLLAHRHLYDMGLDYYRPLGNPARHLRELLRYFSKCKDELITTADYLIYAENVRLNSDEEQTERSRLSEIANAYHCYNQILLDAATLDFGDLIFYGVKLLRDRPQILSVLQKRYRHILVDEFQDVNWSQYTLVRLLALSNVKGQMSNVQLTAVGDDDQSIYAFRGASVSNILRFKEDFPNAREIVLNDNYRSSQEILDVAYKSIQRNNPDRLEAKLSISKKLTAQNSKLKAGVTHFHLPTLDDEVRAVVREIARLKQENQDAAWDDFAILARANSHAEPFVHALESAGIPYEFLASSGLFRQPVVLDCINFFAAVNDRFEPVAFYRLLRLPPLQMKENDIQTIAHMVKKKSINYYEALKRAREFQLSDDGCAKADQLISIIHDGMKRAQTEKPTIVLYQFLEQSGYLAHLAREEGRGNRAMIRAIHHLKQFFDFLARLEQTVAGMTVAQAVEHIRRVVESGDEGKLYQPDDTPDSVNIMTVHGSKGLEFRYVFVVNLVEDRFPARRRGEAIELPNALIKEKLTAGDCHIQEERRLFYVAMTRAKERLYLASAEDYGGTRKKKVSRFIAETGLEIQEAGRRKREEGFIINKSSVPCSPLPAPLYDTPDTFSFSKIKSYQICPYQYKLAHILKIPTKGSASLSFGQSMHNTLQTFYERVREWNGAEQTALFGSENGLATLRSENVKAPAMEELLKMYDEHWIPDWYESQRQRDDFYKKGREILQIFYAAQADRWTVPAILEGGFKIKIGDALFTGKVDRVDRLSDGTLHIIDYKTGKSKEALTSEDKEQLLIYQIAAEALPEYRAIGKPGKLTFWYLNDNIQASFLGEAEELQKLRDKLMRTVSAIRGGDFAATPDQFACDYCGFREICEFRVP